MPECNESNDKGDILPPVLPYQIMKLEMREFVTIMNQHSVRLNNFFTPSDLEDIDQDFVSLKRAIREEPILKAIVDKCDTHTSFKDGWAPMQDCFPKLMDFCGGLATAFPNTASVESDFSIINWEKDDC